jgi:phosphatidylinositol alpha-1,6-mannosyltransferase
MERLNWHMADELTRFADIRVIGPSGSGNLAPDGVIVEEASITPLWRFLVEAMFRALRVGRTWRPEWVVAGSGLTAPLAWLVAKICGAQFAVYVHGLDIAVRHRIYRLIWLSAIRRADVVIANSSATRALALSARVLGARIGIVRPGVRIDPEIGLEANPSPLLARLGLLNRKILVSVGRLSSRKGMREFVGEVLPRVVDVRPDVILLVVGAAPSHALRAEPQSVESIQESADAAGVGENLRFLGVIDDDELAALYRSADVHVFPVREIPGDPEGFGMVAIEAAAHGLPTVAYASGGVVDAVSDGRSGYLVRSGDADSMADAILTILDEGPKLKRTSREFAADFAWQNFGERLFNLLESHRGQQD